MLPSTACLQTLMTVLTRRDGAGGKGVGELHALPGGRSAVQLPVQCLLHVSLLYSIFAKFALAEGDKAAQPVVYSMFFISCIWSIGLTPSSE